MSRLSIALHALAGAALGATALYTLPWTLALLARYAPMVAS